MIPVFWFIGLSGSGKSTMAEAALQYLNANASLFSNVQKWELLDGDVIRSFLGDDIGYSYNERRKSVKIMGLLAKYLSENNVGVIVANIAPFHDLRLFMKSNISNYYEIYCKCNITSCIERDPKGNYKKQLVTGIKDYVGLDIPFQEPENPDLILDTVKLSKKESLSMFTDFVKALNERNSKYD